MFKSSLFKIFFVIAIFAFSNFANAQMVKNAGFTSSDLIVSNDAPVVGESIRISMPVYNETKGIITMVARLYKDNVKISEKTITLKTGEFSGFSYEWKSIPGVHKFTLKLEDTFIQLPKLPKEIIVLENREAGNTVRSQGSGDSGSILKEYVIDSEEQILPVDSGIDSYRQDFLYDAENKITAIRQDISESVKQNEEYEKRLNDLRDTLPRADGSLLTPLQYIYAWALGALAYILSNAYLFYGFLFLIVFLILRSIVRRFRRRHHLHR